MRIPMSLLILGLAALAPAALAQSGPPGERYYSGQGTVTCESLRGGYRECHTGYRAPPQIVRRLSDSECIEGSSWGHRPGMVWVGRGCRAEFQESRGWSGGGAAGNSIVCESRDNRYRECPGRFRGPVDVIEQLSDRQCIEGRTWGQTRTGVWVDRGCRARFGEFYAGSGSGGGGHWGQGTGYSTVCESRDGRRQRCDWDWNRGTPFLQQQYSHAPCVRNRSWGYDTRRQELWVAQGCRGLFGSR